MTLTGCSILTGALGFIYSFLFLLLFYCIFLFICIPQLGSKLSLSSHVSQSTKTLLALGWVSPSGPGNVSVGKEGKDLLQGEKAKYIKMLKQHYMSKLKI